jgi:hypothetical protein
MMMSRIMFAAPFSINAAADDPGHFSSWIPTGHAWQEAFVIPTNDQLNLYK